MALYKVKVRAEYTVDMLIDASGAFAARCQAAQDCADTVEKALLSEEHRRGVVGEVTVDDAVCVTEFS